MLKLIQNELLKLHAKKGMYILMGILVALEIAMAIIIKKWAPAEVQFSGFVSFSEAALSLIIIFTTIFGITLASRTVTEEFQKGTIKQLLIRPRKRITVLFSKYITVILAVIIISISALIISMLIGLVSFGGGKEELTVAMLMKILVYKIVPVLFYVTLSFFLANIFRKSVLPLIITMFIFFLQGTINMLLMMFAKGVAKFVVFSHLDLNVYDSNKLISGGVEPSFAEFNFTTSLLLVLAYFIVLLVASSVLFQKRDVL
ncbi:ABC transporter permease [Bacillus pseudomycoides]|uniref:ABC transporter permease n=1 Tax=Bacillus pseudomycoides TaxID=64104 RepID=UPI000BEC2F02|nr:ABC transporter permease [Bacillus pseudomycoides]PEE44476.1 ABC transporter permease [Bacillus pseudomycoides]PEI88246.1 ABC transporter permease [Bacillus pseudomycoides]PGA90331.1 ABC transporter permease [Bacillus pseudomycoides]PHF51196.1 ABC transporter permease [Bacillus pseudomycoides]